MAFELLPLAEYRDAVLLLARIVFGITFLYYGWPKLNDMRANAKDFEGMGFKPGWLWGTPVLLLETVGSVGIMLGVFTWVWAFGFVIHMSAGTIWKITKAGKPFTGWSYDVLLLLLAVVFLTFGPGAYVVPVPGV